jgi:uncharacterized protein DUF937
MQMQDTLRHIHGGPAVAVLAEAFAVAPTEADATLRAVMGEMAWHLERNTLSRGGLADLVEALGSGHHARYLDDANALRNEMVRTDGNAVLRHVLGTKDRSRALAARAAREAGLTGLTVASMLPALAVIAMARVAAGAKNGLGEVLAVMPSLGRWSSGSPHADLADILRRGCGAGPYAPAKLRRVVRRAIARAAGFPPRGALRWYLQFMLIRPASRPVRTIAARAFRARSPA